MVIVRWCLFLTLWQSVFVPGAWGEDQLAPVIAPQTIDYPVIDTSPYTVSIYTDELLPWLKQYHSLEGDFARQNELAFRYSRRNWNGPDALALVMSHPRVSARTKRAVVHFASAYYNDVWVWHNWHHIYRHAGNAPIVVGMLEIMRSARTLKPDGSDTEWPEAGLLDPQGMPQRIIGVLKGNPELALDVILTLEAYGPLARKEADDLMPLLLSPDPQVVIAAQAAIRKMDPEGLAKFFQLEGKPLTKQQVEAVDDYTSDISEDFPPKKYKLSPLNAVRRVCDLRESDGSPPSEISRMRHELFRFMRLQNALNKNSDFLEQRKLALHFRDQNLPGDWWTLLGHISSDEGGFFGTNSNEHFVHIASALYTKPGAQADMLRVLHDDDPRVAQAMSILICRMYTYKPGMTNNNNHENLVDPDVIPAEFVKVGERHPHLKVDMAHRLAWYKSHSAPYVHTLVPLLLSDDTVAVEEVQQCITQIDPELASDLKIASDVPPHLRSELVWISIEGPPPFMPRQRELIEAYVKEHPPLAIKTSE